MDRSELLSILDQPALRRAWLLYKALECLPLDRAIDMARIADQFVLGLPSEGQIERPRPVVSANSSQPHTALEEKPFDTGVAPSPAGTSGISGRSKLPLSPEQRRSLLDRLARGARNAELAAEFGLAPRQVQGIRISQARITKLGCSQEPPPPKDPPESIEEVVRFLRQQDDVVVRQNDGGFLLNGRFRLGPADLVERANRIRARQGKPAFTRRIAEPETEPASQNNLHPLF